MPIKYRIVTGSNPTNKEIKVFQGKAVEKGKKSLEEISSKISEQSTFSPQDVHTVIIAVMSEVVELVKNGCIVDLGSLGTFRPTIKSRLIEDVDKWNSSLIRSIGICFNPSNILENMISEAEVVSGGYSEKIDLSAFRKQDETEQ